MVVTVKDLRSRLHREVKLTVVGTRAFGHDRDHDFTETWFLQSLVRVSMVATWVATSPLVGRAGLLPLALQSRPWSFEVTTVDASLHNFLISSPICLLLVSFSLFLQNKHIQGVRYENN